MKAIMGLLWRWSWVVTLPVSLVFVYWLVSLASAYSTFQIRFEPSAPFGLHMEGRNQANYMLRRAAASLRSGGTPEGYRTIDLALSETDRSRLNSRLPHSGFTYVPGQLWRNNKMSSVELRYRGDFMPHWAFPKKSWRVKTAKDEPFLGMRRFNLIAPKFSSQLATHLGYRLAATLDLLAPRSEEVFLRVNGENRGLHILVEQLAEETLLNNGRPLGDLFSGDLVGSDAYRGISNKVFDHPGAWEKVLIGSDGDPDDYSKLEELCRIVNSYPSREVHAELSSILDMSAFGRFAAFELLIQYFHTGSHHNWRLYFNPERKSFEPVVWDSNAWGGFELLGGDPPVSLDPAITRLHNMLLGNADFLRARRAALREFFASGSAEDFLDELRQSVSATRMAIRRDPIMRPPDPKKINLILDAFPNHVQRIFDKVRAAYLESESDLSYSRVSDDRLRFQIQGRAGIQLLRLRFSGDMPEDLPVYLSYRRHDRDLRQDISARTRIESGVLVIDLPLCTQLLTRPRFERGFLPELSQRVLPTAYELVIDGLSGVNDLSSVEFDDGTGLRSARTADLPSLLPLNRLYRILPN
ncbi:MAG: CotH kinase family protein [Planctomycetota bacterium]